MHGYKQTLFLQKFRAINLTKLSTLKSIDQKNNFNDKGRNTEEPGMFSGSLVFLLIFIEKKIKAMV